MSKRGEKKGKRTGGTWVQEKSVESGLGRGEIVGGGEGGSGSKNQWGCPG